MKNWQRRFHLDIDLPGSSVHLFLVFSTLYTVLCTSQMSFQLVLRTTGQDQSAGEYFRVDEPVGCPQREHGESSQTFLALFLFQKGVGEGGGHPVLHRRAWLQPSVSERTSSPSLDYGEDTINYNTISLDDHVIMPDPEDEVSPTSKGDRDGHIQSWDWATCLLADLDSCHQWNDTLERQHFVPLQGLLTLGSRKKAQGHQFA